MGNNGNKNDQKMKETNFDRAIIIIKLLPPAQSEREIVLYQNTLQSAERGLICNTEWPVSVLYVESSILCDAVRVTCGGRETPPAIYSSSFFARIRILN